MDNEKRGRPKTYENRTANLVALPEKAKIRANELRGQKPLAQFLGEIICEKLGVDGINT